MNGVATEAGSNLGLVRPPLFHVVLHEPEIPNNTGNIGRTCVATHCALHLIKPLGFDTSEKACRRAGLDYWPRLQPLEHENFEAYLTAIAGGAISGGASTAIASNEGAGNAVAINRSASPRLWLFTTKSGSGLGSGAGRGVSVFDADFRAGDHLIFGKETRGLPDEMLDRYADRLVTLPMAAGERSLNLATAVCAAVYEGLRQLRTRGEIEISADGNRIVTG